MRRADRSTEAAAYRKLYATAAWKRRRAAQLAAHPLCAMCEAAGRVTAASVADHVVPHRGDPGLFFGGELQSLCDEPPWRCHSSVKQREERRGYTAGVTAAGRPIDPHHPWNRR